MFPTVGYQEYELEGWLLAPAYHLDTKNIFKPRNDLIRQLTEKGVVHYDEDVGQLVGSLRRIFASRYNGIQFFVIDTAAAVFYLCARFLRLRKLIVGNVNDTEQHESITTLDQEFQSLEISMI